MSENAISPELSRVAGDICFTPIDVTATIDVRLEPGQLLTGMQLLSDFVLVEAEICQSLIAQHTDVDGSTPEHTITMHPVDELLRPKGFNGRLIDGYVALLPFSVDRVQALDRRHSYQLENELLTNDRPGWRVFFGGTLRKTGAGMAPFLREALYFQKARVSRGSGVSRVLGPRSELVWTPVTPSQQEEEASTARPGSRSNWRRIPHTGTRKFV